VVSVDQRGAVKAWDLFRPARLHDLEQKTADALEHIEKDPNSQTAVNTLREWYAFHGRDVSLQALSSRPVAPSP
jgi:hypothetical protein